MNHSNIEYWENHPSLISKKKAYMLDDLLKIAKNRDDRGVEEAIASGLASFHWAFTIDNSAVSEEERRLFYSEEYPQHTHSYSYFKDGNLLFTVNIKK